MKKNHCYPRILSVFGRVARLLVPIQSNLVSFCYHLLMEFFITKAGGKNLERIFNFENDSGDMAIAIISGGACICYTMFFYKTLEAITLLPKKVIELILAILAPFAASTFLTAGIEGTEALGISAQLAIMVGVVLFILRILNCIYSSPFKGLEIN
jgi:hypothetical protein